MATAKKTTKKPTTKKAPVRSSSKTTVRRVTASKPKKQSTMKSFAPAKPETPFMTFRPTQQTIYWLVLAVMVISLGFWVMSINQKVQSIYDQIDAANMSTYEHPAANQTR